METFLNIPNNVAIIFLTALNFNKFIILQFLNLRKDKIFDQKEGNITMKWYIKLFKMINKPYLFVIYFAIFYFLICIIELLVLSVFNFKCGNLQGLASTSTSAIFILLIIIYGIILFICDLVLNFQKIKKCEIKRIYKQDPFNIRFEIYFLGVLCAGSLYVIYFITSVTNMDNLYEFTVFSIVFIFVYLLLIGFPILATILRMIKLKIKPKFERGELSSFLNTFEGFEIMLKACREEFSIENISCWKDIQFYQKEKSLEQRILKVDHMMNLYLNGNSSEMEINLPHEILFQTLTKIKKKDYETDLFVELERQLLLNMNDTFMRLLTTTEYLSFKSMRQLQKDSDITK